MGEGWDVGIMERVEVLGLRYLLLASLSPVHKGWADGGSHVEQRLQQVLEDNRRVEMAFQRYVGVNWLWRLGDMH